MSDYVNRCALEANGVVFEDFESFTENSVTFAKAVNLMNKTGFASMVPRYGFSVNVKKNIAPPPINLYAIKNGTFTAEYEGGDRVDFGGVRTLESGDGAIDGETEQTNTIVYGAETRTPPLD